MVSAGSTLLNYRIQEKLGAGGQGTVYKAVDTKLGRTVVIKVLPPELTVKHANLKRFEREARLASALDHPNICTIFDLNEVEGVHFIVMQYLEGKNVRQLVAGRPLELRSALAIAIQVADALSSAHARGIIHRDIKAGNVMVSETGQVKVLDFGLAKLLDEDEARAEGIHQTQLTEIGVPYGTATYAAPEQARGDRVDARADIFSTGVLIYEMLTGTWPFRGKNRIDVRHAVLHDMPQPIAESRTDAVPASLQQVVDRALAKEPRDRYQKMTEMRDDLKKVLQEVVGGSGEHAGILEGAVAPRHAAGTRSVSRALRWLQGIGSHETSRSQTGAMGRTVLPQEIHLTPVPSLGEKEKKSVAILPFRNLNNDPETNFYEFSLADAVITELARVRSLVVRPSSVIAKYQGQQPDPRDVGRELSVGAVLAAAFLHASNRIRVTAQLLDVASSNILWSDRIDVEEADIIGVQDTIARRIVEGLRIELTSEEEVDLDRRATRSPAAYEEYLRGRDCFGRYIFRTVAEEDFKAAVSHFQRAVELDPSFALAHSGLGASYANRVIKGFGGAEDYSRAEAAFEAALAADPDVVEARMLMIFIYLVRGEKSKARAEVARLAQKSPNDPAVYFVKGTLHRLDGEYERSMRSWDRLARLDPEAQVVASYNRARLFQFMGRSEEAMRELNRASAIEPNHPVVKTFRALTLYHRGDSAAATLLMEQLLSRYPEMHGVRPIYAMCLSAQGRHQAAREQLDERVKASASVDHDFAYWLASAYAVEGENGTALEWLERAIKLGNENRAWFEKDRSWSALRDDPRFRALMDGINSPSLSRSADVNP
jgi:serine/threonine protein kinase/tetratricopeptide (TPR) repeat protein